MALFSQAVCFRDILKDALDSVAPRQKRLLLNSGRKPGATCWPCPNRRSQGQERKGAQAGWREDRAVFGTQPSFLQSASCTRPLMALGPAQCFLGSDTLRLH